jgi:hypothetical protein
MFSTEHMRSIIVCHLILFIDYTGPPSEASGVFVLQNTIQISSVRLCWTVGTSNGAGILFHTVEAQPAMSDEWYIAIDCKFIIQFTL